MQRKASAVWKGGLKDGKGTISSASGILSNTPYSFTTRFENAPGTNPEELIAAAHGPLSRLRGATRYRNRGSVHRFARRRNWKRRQAKAERLRTRFSFSSHSSFLTLGTARVIANIAPRLHRVTRSQWSTQDQSSAHGSDSVASGQVIDACP